ncbi:MAG: FkbM family methyltransferase [Pseudomonadota bacterium]
MNALAYANHAIPLPARVAKHAVFGLLPGQIGLRNRACFHHLTKPRAELQFNAALATVRPGDICIDCGANRGDYTKRFARAGADTYAFEPDPWSFAELTRRAGRLRGTHLINKAVGTATGTLPFFRDADFEDAPEWCSLGSSIFCRTDRPQEEIKVEIVDFLAFLRGLDRTIRILKMDIEGAEVPILETLFASDLMERIDYLFVETHELQFPELLERTWALRARRHSFPGTAINLDWH